MSEHMEWVWDGGSVIYFSLIGINFHVHLPVWVSTPQNAYREILFLQMVPEMRVTCVDIKAYILYFMNNNNNKDFQE